MILILRLLMFKCSLININIVFACNKDMSEVPVVHKKYCLETVLKLHSVFYIQRQALTNTSLNLFMQLTNSRTQLVLIYQVPLVGI